MKKVLFLAYLFPPILNSGTYRSIKFTKYLPKYNWKPTVVTVKDPPDRPLEYNLLNLISPDTNIVRMPLFSKILADNIAKIFPKDHRKKISDALEWRIRSLFFFPDQHASWLHSAFHRSCLLLKENHYDLIFATGYPWTSFWIAYKLYKKFKIPYVLDYRDPWTGSPLWSGISQKNLKEFIKRKFSPLLERKLVLNAKAIIVTTSTFADVIKRQFNHHNVFVITNGFDPDLYDNISKSKLNLQPIKIVYTGIWKKGYGPESLYQALSILKQKYPDIASKVKFICAGFPPGPAKNHNIAEMVEEIGPISYDKAIKLISSADILFMPVASGRFAYECIPGKFFDYIGAKKPVILVAPRDSLLWKMLSDKDFVFKFLPKQVNELAAFIKKISENRKMLARAPEEQFRNLFNVSILTKKLAKIFDDCIKNHAQK